MTVLVWETPSFVAGVDDVEHDIIRGLFDKWQRKYPRNLLRSTYFDAKMPVQSTGNIPEEAMRKIRAVLDWPEKAVSALADRSVFEGFVSPGAQQDPFDLASILDANRFDLELPQVITSAYKHSCAFITTALGDVASGEPEVLVVPREAMWSAATWDQRRRSIAAAMAVTSTDDVGRPDSLDVYLPSTVLTLTRRPSGSWVVVDRRPNPLGEVLVEAICYDPQLDRPFGRSRISRPVMNITDHALTTIVRSEISSDFYAVPRMYALGVSEDAFSRGKWQAAIDRWFAITKDENGDAPTVGQFPQMTMQPIHEQYRMYATQFSGATGVPVSSLGILTDNPPSAEALYADDRRIVATANRQNRIMASGLKRMAQKVIRLRDGGIVTDEMQKLSASWMNPTFTSPITSATALRELSTVFPWLSESEVALEYAGFSHAQITRLLADKSRYDSRAFTRALSAVAAGRSDASGGSGTAQVATVAGDDARSV
ncbi:phage portal protein [Microbacterium gilvum]|uniref:Phage portal protein n=1 Tax=Microbacterium gilvum TaxID=1336204 RepID=A0ABP9A8M1_9MICO